jgi:hypothetical protein
MAEALTGRRGVVRRRITSAMPLAILAALAAPAAA